MAVSQNIDSAASSAWNISLAVIKASSNGNDAGVNLSASQASLVSESDRRRFACESILCLLVTLSFFLSVRVKYTLIWPNSKVFTDAEDFDLVSYK